MGFDLTTFIFEIVNFVVLVVLLHFIAYKPLKKAIQARRQRLADGEARVAAALAEAEAGKLELERSLAQVRAAADAARAKAVEEGASERARIIEQARIDAEAERARARTMVDFERQAAEIWVREATIEQGTALAGRLLIELAPDRLQGILLEHLITAVDHHGQRLREGHLAGDTIEVAAARSLDHDALESLRTALAAALGKSPDIITREDPELVGGFVLRSGAHVLDASIAGQLALVRDKARAILGEDAHV